MAAISALIRAAGFIGPVAGAAGGGAGGAGGAVQMAGQVGGGGNEAAAAIGQAATLLDKMGGAAQRLLDPVGLLNSALSEALGPLNKIIGSVQELNSRYVGLFSPAEVKLFDMAVRDLYATIGEWLVPVTREATKLVREIGGYLNGLTPFIKAFVKDGLEAMRPAVQALGEMFKELLGLALPFVQIAAEMQLDIWRGVAVAVKLVADSMKTLYRTLRELLGLPAFEPRDNTGKAVANTSQQSVQSYLTNLQLNALKMGRGEEEGGPKAQFKMLIAIKDAIETAVRELPKKIAEGVASLPGAIGQAVAAQLPGGGIGRGGQGIGRGAAQVAAWIGG